MLIVALEKMVTLGTEQFIVTNIESSFRPRRVPLQQLGHRWRRESRLAFQELPKFRGEAAGHSDDEVRLFCWVKINGECRFLRQLCQERVLLSLSSIKVMKG